MDDMQAFDSRSFRNALGRFATGVTIVTAEAADGTPLGMTMNSFASVSLDPPLVLWSLDRRSPRFDDWVACSHYAISILSAEQVALSNHFATPAEDKFTELDWQPGLGGAPLLADMHTTFQCANQARHDGGDHLIFVGRVMTFEARTEQPLLFVGGEYALSQPLNNA